MERKNRSKGEMLHTTCKKLKPNLLLPGTCVSNIHIDSNKNQNQTTHAVSNP